MHTLPRLRRAAQDQHHLARGTHRSGIQIEPHRLAQGAHAALEIQGHDALELGAGALHGLAGLGQAKLLCGQQPKRQRDGLVIGKHHRGEFVAGAQLVGSVTPTLGQDRDAQVLQHVDVAPQGADIDFQAFGQGRAGHLSVRLQQLQNGQYACSWMIHIINYTDN